MRKSNSQRIFTGDFETTTATYSTDMTRVWLWAVCPIEHWDKDESVITGTDMIDFEWFLSGNRVEDGDVIWFHNLKFDGTFIINHLLHDGYEHCENVFKYGSRLSFDTLISEEGAWYQIRIRIKNKVVTIKNSLCLLTTSVENIAASFNTRKKKMDMIYDNAKVNPKDITKEDLEYIKADVQIMAEVLNVLINQYGLDKLTAGANAINDYIKRIRGSKKFLALFPELEEELDIYLRPGYKGGWSYVNPDIKEVLIEEPGMTVDANGLYSSMMHSSSGNLFPYGEPMFYEGFYNDDGGVNGYPLWAGRCIIMCEIKDKKLPCIQVKKSLRFAEHDWLDVIDVPTEMVITSVDWEIVQETYEIIYIKWLDGYKFHGAAGLFDKFIDYWQEVKTTSSGAQRELAKLMLNSLYGKFATRLFGSNKVPYLGEKGELRYTYTNPEKHKGYYLPVGMFTTSYARCFTIRAANANYERFCYSDTDSVHAKGTEPLKDMEIHKSALSCWKVEMVWDSAKFLRQKTYMEHPQGADSKEWDVKCAGMPANIKQGFILDENDRPVFDDKGRKLKYNKIMPSDFYIGNVFPTGKLRPKQVKGGTILLDSPFKIREVVVTNKA